MNAAQIQSLADGVASMLLSHAAHGLATSAIEGMGEITLRDGLVVAAAAVGAQAKQAWLLNREVLPPGWTDATVDLIVSRQGNQGTNRDLGGVELKWWRQTDPNNASNRRRDLIKDFMRAAALYSNVEDFAFVALLSTTGAWGATASTSGTDKPAMTLLNAAGTQKWRLPKLIGCSAVRNAVTALNGRVPIANIFHTELLASLSLSSGTTELAFARVWSVRKPQNTKFLLPQDVTQLLQ